MRRFCCSIRLIVTVDLARILFALAMALSASGLISGSLSKASWLAIQSTNSVRCELYGSTCKPTDPILDPNAPVRAETGRDKIQSGGGQHVANRHISVQDATVRHERRRISRPVP